MVEESNAHFTKELPVTGLPGQRLYVGFYIRTETLDGTQPPPFYGGAPGEYQIVFTLSCPGSRLHEENELVSADQLKGDSHLAIVGPALLDPLAPDADRITVGFEIPTIGNVEFTGYPNDDGYLGKIELKSLVQPNFNEAEAVAYYLLAPLLSYWSTYLDIPLHVHQIDVIELSTGSRQVSFTNPFQGAPFALAPWVGINNDWRGYASLYREALNSNSTAYQFLCLFKIIEGIRRRQKRLDRAAKKEGRTIARPQVQIPSDQGEQTRWLQEIFPADRKWDAFTLTTVFVPESIGKPVSDPYLGAGDIYNDVLKPLRHDISHALFEDSGELTLSVDEAFNIRKINTWLPLTRCIVRRLLKDEFPNELSFKPARPIQSG